MAALRRRDLTRPDRAGRAATREARDLARPDITEIGEEQRFLRVPGHDVAHNSDARLRTLASPDRQTPTVTDRRRPDPLSGPVGTRTAHFPQRDPYGRARRAGRSASPC